MNTKRKLVDFAGSYNSKEAKDTSEKIAIMRKRAMKRLRRLIDE